MSGDTKWQRYVTAHPEVAEVHGIDRVALRQRVRHGEPHPSGWLPPPERGSSDGFQLGWWRPHSRVKKLGRLAKRRAAEVDHAS